MTPNASTPAPTRQRSSTGDNRLLTRNLRAVAARDPQLARILQRTRPHPTLRWTKARSGHPVPVTTTAGGRELALHSLYDPRREARRLPQFDSGGMFVFLGCGAAHHVVAFLECASTSAVLIVEPDLPLLRSALEHIDLTGVFSDARVVMAAGYTAEQLASTVTETYLPAVDGGLQTVALQSLTRAAPQRYRSALDAIRAALEHVSVDYTTQARFGLRWFCNILANLPLAEGTTGAAGDRARRLLDRAQRRARRAIVVGAGPTLETELDTLRAADALCIACDTALPVLQAHGLAPDIVVSVDCQHSSYLHFLARDHDALVVLDLASPPLLARRLGEPLFFSGGHPLTRYLARVWRPLPELPTAAGNVAFTATALARALGAADITLVGTDYSFPGGKRYARHSAVYPLMWSGGGRLSPVQWLDLAPIFGAQPARSGEGRSVVYQTAQTRRYRSALEDAAPGWEQLLTHRAGTAPPLRLPGAQTARVAAVGADDLAGVRQIWLQPAGNALGWREMLRRLSQGLLLLPAPYAPLRGYLANLANAQRDLVTVTLPAAAALRERGRCDGGHDGAASPRAANGNTQVAPEQVVARARDWALQQVERTARMGDD